MHSAQAAVTSSIGQVYGQHMSAFADIVHNFITPKYKSQQPNLNFLSNAKYSQLINPSQLKLNEKPKEIITESKKSTKQQETSERNEKQTKKSGNK